MTCEDDNESGSVKHGHGLLKVASTLKNQIIVNQFSDSISYFIKHRAVVTVVLPPAVTKLPLCIPSSS